MPCFYCVVGAGEFVVKRADLAMQFMIMFRLAYILASHITDKDKTLTKGCSFVPCIATYIVRRAARHCDFCSQGYLTG
jgi:hypothetical protein